MECINCGKMGHTFRDCKSHVLSFGICAIKFIERTPYYLLIRRRDSLAYVEFLRGKYKMDNREYIQLLIDGMTTEEKTRLCVQPFEKLWENLWNSQNTRQYRNEFENAKRTFEALKNMGDICGRLLDRYIEDTTTNWTDAEWGFPKGRRTLHETDIACALREFAEETGFPTKILSLCRDEPPIIEEYVGTNGIPYRQVYFIGGCASNSIAEYQPYNRIMSREVGDIGWFPYEIALEKIRKTNIEKRNALTELHSRVGLYEKISSSLEWIAVS
jgi:8-oxo-dGTP pyrophosphatase MutT (NUDIX family)